MKFSAEGDLNFQLTRILNQGIEFADNVRGAFIEFVTSSGDTTIEHNLGYTPIGWLVILKTSGCDLWAVRLTEWNSTNLYLRSSVPNVTVRLFVL